MDPPYRGISASGEAAELACLYCGGSRSHVNGRCMGCGAPPHRVPCTRCAQPITWPQDACPSCGAVCEAWRDPAPHELACPRCGGVLARSTALDLFVDECTRCKGSLLSPRELTRIAEHVTEHEAMSVGRFVPPPPGQEIPRQTMLALVTCPGCRQPMERTNFASYGGLAVDLCATHGMWLDAGELVALILLLERRRDDPDSFREASIGSPFEDPRRSREILAENERRAREDERRWRDESSDDPQLEAMRAQQSDAYNKSLVIDTALEQLGKLLSAWVRMRR